MMVSSYGPANMKSLAIDLPSSLAEIAQAQDLDDDVQALKLKAPLGAQQSDIIEWEIQQDVLYRAVPTKAEGEMSACGA
ncbi:5-aminolevulinate synthase mitochondrial [Dissostichus eleginoides]|uniref:5-aminolevulinate synthase mitochondrial n=1 Tax=Dissostichus eleginoides TaxID=100907 RepID=A0AAD9B8F6_DISEL|nr:5-aminolevulinate synthase mitochondrial [Dissostichus eleginoides]